MSEDEYQTFKWNHSMNLLLISEYKKLKDDFKNPKFKKINLWRKIAVKLSSYGQEIDAAAVYKKFRNMKTTYLNCKQKEISSQHARIKWDYFKDFDEILQNDETVNASPFFSFVEVEPEISYSQPQSEEDCLSFTNKRSQPRPLSVKRDETESNSTERCKRLRRDRNNIFEIEKIKCAKLDEMINTMKERNNIFREMADILEAASSSTNVGQSSRIKRFKEETKGISTESCKRLQKDANNILELEKIKCAKLDEIIDTMKERNSILREMADIIKK